MEHDEHRDPDTGPDTGPEEPRLEDLPDAVRARVVGLVAAVLPQVPNLPPAVRRVASFAPARRARLGSGALVAALADDDLRRRVLLQLGEPPVEASGEEGDPVEQAARAWLHRPAGWTERLRAALELLGEGTGTDTASERLRRRAEQAEQALREQRAGHRAQAAEYKSEIATLRRRVGEARTAERAARAEAEQARAEADAARAAAAAEVAGREKELRRLRAQLAAAHDEVAGARRSARAGRRAERDEATLRARLLLDTVLEAAAGLQRELGLPSVAGAPGDRVEAALEQARTPAPGEAAEISPAMLEQVLAMPRARLLVDGYNVSKTAWPDSSLEAQRIRLLGALGPLVARTGAETTVVFDAADSSTRPVVPGPRAVKVRFSPEGVIADDVIRDLVAAEPPGRVTVVVTSDRAVATDVVRAGARSVAAQTLVALLSRTG